MVYLVMACLGELAIAYPVSGAFHIYAARSIGPATGFATAWLYWLCWAVAIGSEFTASGLLMQRWFPDVAVWVWCLVFAAVLFGFNAVSARFFGESEFWFAIIKVAAIIGLIVLGGAALFGFQPLGGGGDGHPFLFENFATEGGLFPNGFTGVLVTVLAVFYAFSGSELIGVAAGETKDPATTIPKAMRTTVIRLLIFFVGAIAVIAATIPYTEVGAGREPVRHGLLRRRHPVRGRHHELRDHHRAPVRRQQRPVLLRPHALLARRRRPCTRAPSRS